MNTQGRLAERLDAMNWQTVGDGLSHNGCVVIPELLTPQDCRALAALYAEEPPLRVPGILCKAAASHAIKELLVWPRGCR